MEASERTISQLLTEQIRYEIPPYQGVLGLQSE